MTGAQRAAFASYLALSAAGHLVWEVAQLPLYAIWRDAQPRELAFAVVHCTVGDVMIAAMVLGVALVLVWARRWPWDDYRAVAAVAICLGVVYAGSSEWLNVYVRGSWSYTAQMPTVRLAGYALGLSPLLQWIAVPLVVFAIHARRFATPAGSGRPTTELDRTG